MNESYGNGDILPERSYLNVQFKSCVGYEQEFNRMVDDGTISLRGLKSDAKVFDELVFDVNSAYFENNGGYDYAKAFFAEAYRLAVKEVGVASQYHLLAVGKRGYFEQTDQREDKLFVWQIVKGR